MGYNGGINKRGYYRRQNGMYKKSSYRYGEKILSNFIKVGIGLITAVVNSADLSSSDISDSPQISVNDLIVQSLTSEKFHFVRDNYISVVHRNKLLKKRILSLRLKIILDFILMIFCCLIPKYKNSLNKKIKAFNEAVELIKNKISEPIIDVSSLFDDNCSVNTLLNRGKIRITFHNVCDYTFLNGYIDIAEKYDKYFKCSATAVGEFKSKQMQLYLYSKGLVVMRKNVFAVVDYKNVTSNFTKLYVKTDTVEDGIRKVGTTWRYSKINGDRDLRYNDNYEIDIVEYGCLRLELDNKLTINLLFSDVSYGRDVSKIFNNVSIDKEVSKEINIKSIKSINKDSEICNRNSRNRMEENFIDDNIKITYNKAETTDFEDKLIRIIKDYGKPLNSRIAYKCPKIGSSVKRRGDGAILYVINITPDNKLKCFDFEKNECFLYRREELMLY